MNEAQKIQLTQILGAVQRLDEQGSESGVQRAEVLAAVAASRERVDAIATEMAEISRVLFRGNGDSVVTQLKLLGKASQKSHAADVAHEERFAVLEKRIAAPATGVGKSVKSEKKTPVLAGLLSGLSLFLTAVAYWIAAKLGIKLPGM